MNHISFSPFSALRSMRAAGFFLGALFAGLSAEALPAPLYTLMGMGQMFRPSGETVWYSTPVRFAGKVMSVATAGDYFYINTSKELRGCGWNPFGQLGDGTTNNRFTPFLIASDVASVAAGGENFTLYLTSSGDLYAMGMGTDGELGDASTYGSLSPEKIDEGVSAVWAGDKHSLYLKGTDLYGMGYNGYGQLGDGTTINHYSPIKIASNVAKAAAGYMQSYYISTTGELYATGKNDYGQLGDKTRIERHGFVKIADNVASVAGGFAHSLYVTTDGNLYAMGGNTQGQLGIGTYDYGNHSTPEFVASGVSRVAIGSLSSYFITTGGDLYAMGNNLDAQLGTGSTDSSPSPVKIAENVVGVSASEINAFYLTTSCLSPYWPGYNSGWKWDATMGWIYDAAFPWVWSWTGNNWYYVYDGLDARPACDGYWIAYYTSDGSDYGWGYVVPGKGWWCLPRNSQVLWRDIGQSLP